MTVSNKYPLTCTVAELFVFSVFLHCPCAVVLSEREKKQPCHKVIWLLALKNWSKEGFNTKIKFGREIPAHLENNKTPNEIKKTSKISLSCPMDICINVHLYKCQFTPFREMLYNCLKCQCHSALLCNVKGLNDKNNSVLNMANEELKCLLKTPNTKQLFQHHKTGNFRLSY